jgi:protein subunit release factor A
MPRELIFSAGPKDFRIDYFSGTGAGGQYRNKHQNCVRMTHIATGIVTTGQTERDRPSNLRNAFRKMAALLVKHYVGEERKARWRGNQDTIRTYHEPDNRVVDHLSGHQQEYRTVVDKRALSEMIDVRRDAMLVQLAKERFKS